MTDQTNLERIQAAGAQLVLHINYGNGYGYIYKCTAEPRISLHIGGPKGRKSKRERYRYFRVGDDEFKTLEEAVLAVEKIDRLAAQDAEWEAAEIAAVVKARRPKLAAIDLGGDGGEAQLKDSAG